MKDYEAGKNYLGEKTADQRVLYDWLQQQKYQHVSGYAFVSHRKRYTNLFFPFLSSGQLYGLEKFWAFLKYSKAKTMEIDPKLQEYLHKFKRLEDFRIDVSKCFCGI